MPRFFVANLILIVLLGVGVSGWILYYTDFFPEFTGLLALGGLFSWLAFFLKILPDYRIKELQQLADRTLSKRTTLLWTATIAAGALVLVSFRGTVEVQSLQETTSHPITVSSTAIKPDPEELPPGSVRRWNRWTVPFLPQTAIVQAGGYPSRTVQVSSWHKTKLFVGSSFLRPAVLVRPSPDLYIRIHNYPVKLFVTVSIGGKQVSSQSITFIGQALWIGCDGDVEVPSSLKDHWKKNVSENQQYMIDDWVHPQSVLPDISSGSTIEIMTRVGEDVFTKKQSFAVNALTRPQDFPQEVVLNAPPKPSDSSAVDQSAH